MMRNEGNTSMAQDLIAAALVGFALGMQTQRILGNYIRLKQERRDMAWKK